MPTNRGYYDVFDYGERFIPGVFLKIEKSVFCNDEKSDISELVALPANVLNERRSKSVTLEQAAHDEVIAAVNKWEKQAAATQLLDRSLEYQKAPVCSHSSKPGAPICLFIDWRQLPCMSDALQWAGWIWRGTLVWDKTNSRPQRGRFRQPMPAGSKRIHQTEKPLAVMREIVRIVEPGGVILDPFAGAGTTMLAAKLEGYPAIGIEVPAHYAAVARKRIAECDAES